MDVTTPRFLFYALLAALPGCGDGPSSPPTPVAIVRISRDTATLVPGASLTLSAFPQDAQGKALPRTVAWTTSNALVATVSNGAVSALAPGVVAVTATAGGVSGTTQLTVKDGAVVGPQGSTFSVLGGSVFVTVPPGAAIALTQFVVSPVSISGPAPRLVPGTAFELAPASPLNSQVGIGVKYDPATLVTGASQKGLKIYSLSGGKWERVQSSIIDTATNRVDASVNGTGTFAIFEQAPAAGAVDAGDGQSSTVGTKVAIAPAIKVTDVEGFPVSDIAVQFAITAGSGSVSSGSALTNKDGIATSGGWTLGTKAGTNTVTASVAKASGGPFVFTATGVTGASARLLFVTAPPASVQSTVAFGTQPSVQISDEYGNPVLKSGVNVAVAITAGAGSLSGTLVRPTGAAGVATFTDLVLSGSSGQKALTFTSGDLPPLSAYVNVKGGSVAAVEPNAGNNQTAVAGAAVLVKPAIRVTDVAGDPVANLAVSFTVASGEGQVTGGETITDVNGIAQVGSWTVGKVAGTNTLRAAASSGGSFTFTATGVAGPSAKLVYSIAPPASVQSTVAFGTQPSVQITDEYGNPVLKAGVNVAVAITAGSGSLSGTLVRPTGASGVAAFTDLVLSGSSGQKALAFTSGNLPPLSAFVNVKGGSGAAVELNAGNNQTAIAGTTVLVKPAIRVTDVAGDPVANLAVSFTVASGEGQVTGGETITDVNGIAQVASWIVGKVAGTNTLRAVASGLPNTPVVFTAAGIPGPPASIVLASGGNQVGPAGRGPRDAILFRVFDANGNGVPDVDVRLTVVAGGGTLPSTAKSLSTGVVVVHGWTFGQAAGLQRVQVSIDTGSPLTSTADATAVTIRIVTFGDSNTDYGYLGNGPTPTQFSYVSSNPGRPSAATPNSPTQLAGKIEILWTTAYSPAVLAVNHGILGTGTGPSRSTVGAPGALTYVNGVNRFMGEVLGFAYPWSGGEPVNSSYSSGPIARVKSFIPTVNDFAYVSIGTNDGSQLISSAQTYNNLGQMIDLWTSRGLPADHFILTDLAPTPGNTEVEAQRNRDLRSLAIQKGVKLIALTAFTSNDDGITWKSSSLHIGDGVHYAESVRDWIAQQVVAIMAAATVPLP